MAVDAVAVTRRGRAVHALFSRSAASGLETAQATLYQPNLERAVAGQRKNVLVAMSAGFFAFGIFLTWLLVE